MDLPANKCSSYCSKYHSNHYKPYYIPSDKLQRYHECERYPCEDETKLMLRRLFEWVHLYAFLPFSQMETMVVTSCLFSWKIKFLPRRSLLSKKTIAPIGAFNLFYELHPSKREAKTKKKKKKNTPESVLIPCRVH